ncbi:hypothetical protein BpHYR1_032608 [Brachionus plicatilis]|uniref:Uncharacterized protein n=1 Tax=Brachionus plicatilis TaxID=10195 RepID=A0A3M7QZD4_BRAPC|nr:hypothetical protein BpHYR1_032608 [Brachionus plicatilis]
MSKLNTSQDQAFEPNSKGKTRGKGKSYFPFSSFRSLDDTKKCLDREFEGNNWIVKGPTETLQADMIWYQCTKCAIRLKSIAYLEN